MHMCTRYARLYTCPTDQESVDSGELLDVVAASLAMWLMAALRAAQPSSVKARTHACTLGRTIGRTHTCRHVGTSARPLARRHACTVAQTVAHMVAHTQ